MNTTATNPEIDMVQDFRDLQTLVFEDVAGDKTRGLTEYFEQAAQKSLQLQISSTDFEQKEFARMVHEAFLAAKRIVIFAWAKAHGSDLVA